MILIKTRYRLINNSFRFSLVQLKPLYPRPSVCLSSQFVAGVIDINISHFSRNKTLFVLILVVYSKNRIILVHTGQLKTISSCYKQHINIGKLTKNTYRNRR